jgi:hypothetical protein
LPDSDAALFGLPPVVMPEPVPVPLVTATERVMLDALHQRYGRRYGNGRRYVVAEHVRAGAGFGRRTADFIAADCWEVTGRFDLIGHEVKVSRSDWLRELKEPEKAAEFIPFVNRWWLVVPDARLLRDGELPEGWGLLALAGKTLRAVKAAPRREAEPMPPTRLVALMRAVQATAAKRAAKPNHDKETFDA